MKIIRVFGLYSSPLFNSEIVRLVNSSESTITGKLKDLREVGLIVSVKEGRKNMSTLTPQGYRLVRELRFLDET